MTIQIIVVFWLNRENYICLLSYDSTRTIEEQVKQYEIEHSEQFDTNTLFGILETVEITV